MSRPGDGGALSFSATQTGVLVPAWTKDDLDRSATARFARVAGAVPERLALAGTSDSGFTYRELHAEVLLLAAEILDRIGPGPGYVGLLADLSPEAVVGMLAILSARKAYVPIDPTEPASMAQAKIENALVRLVLAPGSLRKAASDLVGIKGSVLVLDGKRSKQVPPEMTQVGPDDHFNLIYTSGVTGGPKGVVQTHRNVVFDTQASSEIHLTTPDDQYGLVVPLSFGASVSDVMGALLNGAALHVLDLRREGIDAMAVWMRERSITVTHMVPTVFRRWMAALGADDQYPAMRSIKVGGEALLHPDFEAFCRHFDDACILRNGLGTTETYLIATNLLRRSDAPQDKILPVGKAVLGRTLAIVDADRTPVGPGEVGQIAVTSRYLSPGYWRDQDATDRAYFSNPAGGDQRTYLTGDLGRIRPDGLLEHLGRMDDMVKIRGQRVNPAEVETVLLALPGVAEAAVIAQPTENGDNRLVAYIVAAGRLPSVSELRAELAVRLPPHMIPSTFVPLDELPILRFGKVDRRSLPQPGGLRPDLDVDYVAARTDNEDAIAGVAAALLGIGRVGVNDDLFDLGLDSLVATQLIGRVGDLLGVRLPLDSVFASPTVAGLAARIEDRSDATATGDLESILKELEALDEDQARDQLVNGA